MNARPTGLFTFILATLLIGLISLNGCSQQTIESAREDAARNAEIEQREAQRVERKARPHLKKAEMSARVTAALTANEKLPKTIRVDADENGVRIRNILGRHEVPWSAVRAVRFDRNSAWASLLLTNDDELAILAVQAGDRMRAVRAVEGLRALLAHAQAIQAANEPAKPPLLYDD